MGIPAAVEARRFLHCCYGCDDLTAATAFVTDGLGLDVFMQVTDEPFDGSVLGLEGMVEASACFAYDHRGPRTSPAIEIQAWVDPPAEGEPHTSPLDVGLQAFGCAVGDLDAALAKAQNAGATLIGRSAHSELFGAASATIRDPNRITFDLVTDSDAPGATSRLAHLRLGCLDLGASVRWYERLGFTVRRRHDEVAVDAEVLGAAGTMSLAELTLPDEPMGLLLLQWLEPAPVGAHYACANHRGIYRAALGVDDTRAAVRALEADGIAITRQPELLELKGTPVPDMWIAFLADPDGVPIEFVERPRSAFRDSDRAG